MTHRPNQGQASEFAVSSLAVQPVVVKTLATVKSENREWWRGDTLC